MTGLSEAEAARRLQAEGYNELPSSRRYSFLARLYEIIREPMFIMLIAGGAIYLVLGELRDAALLLGFVFVVVGITFYQERKTDRALAALRNLSSPRAAVIRDGRVRRIPGREVVRGDVLLLSEGDRIPADAELLESDYLLVDESLLTGESVPVSKTICDSSHNSISAAKVFSGTLVVQGQGRARVTAIGAQTRLGAIGAMLSTSQPETNPLQHETGRLVRNLALAGLSLCLVVVAIYYLRHHDLLQALLAGITMAMAILPEEIPVVLTIFLALGAWRMAQKHALTRRLTSIQALGSATVLCVDKTGTLTRNQMAVSRIYAQGTTYSIEPQNTNTALAGAVPEACHQTIEFAILASQQTPVDPMETALKELGESRLGNTEHLHRNWSLVHEYPLSRTLLAMSRVWRSPDGSQFVIAAKGAYEAISDLCHLSPESDQEYRAQLQTMADDGLRVIAVASAQFPFTQLPEIQHDFVFTFIGLIGFADPVREQVPVAVEECRRAGVRVVMITGDYAGTARQVAQQAGLTVTDIISGRELADMTDSELRLRAKTTDIFARIAPEQKLRLVRALQANDEVVIMTGDGVNDAPALKSAHVGIAMGARGTDVAREAADIVLLDDDFSTIVQALRQGRRILDNLKKAIAYVLSIHVPIAGLSLLPVLFNWKLILLPVHVVFLELIIDPACSIVFEAEPEESDTMTRPPRTIAQPLFDRRTTLLSLLQGLAVLAITLGIYAITLHQGKGETEARALTFTALVVANLSLILTNRSWTRTISHTLRTRNPALWWVIGGALALLALVLTVPALRNLFRFGILHSDDIIFCLGAGVISIVWFELFKLIRRFRPRSATAL